MKVGSYGHNEIVNGIRGVIRGQYYATIRPVVLFGIIVRAVFTWGRQKDTTWWLFLFHQVAQGG